MKPIPIQVVTVFAKEPVAGRVKTRLTPEFSPEQAARLAAAMLEDTIEKLQAARAFETRLAVAPAESVARLQAQFPDVPVVAQSGDGLGERMARHFEVAFAQDADGIFIIVGSDAPHTPVARVHEAFEALAAGARVVLGPDDGGGYYLVGLQGGVVPGMFTEIEMSTGSMCDQTVEFVRQRDVSVELLASSYDLDHPADLVRLQTELSSGASTDLNNPRRVAALLEKLR